MKIKQIQGIKYKMFEESDLIEKLKMSNEEVKLVMDYQVKFPELMIENGEGFCIDARLLHKNLVKNVKENITGTEFSKWIKRRIAKYKFVKNSDFISVAKFDDAKFSIEEISKMTIQKMSSLGITVEYKLTLDTAKQLCMIENNDLGLLCRRYFILMEKTLNNYENWINIREPEKSNANVMKEEIKNWCNRKGFDSETKAFYSREFNMLNSCLTNKTAIELRTYIGYKDSNTTEHLTIEINNALNQLELLNISLLIANMSFEQRKNIIKMTCDSQYNNLKII